MITIFGTPRPFRGHFGIIQRNAIGSWMQLRPRPQVLVMGNDEGTAEACAELGVTHVPDIECNEFETPLVSSMIARAEELAQFELMLVVSTDIILFNDTMDAARILYQRFKRFCAVASRKELNIQKLIDFHSPPWEQELRRGIDPTLPDNILAGDYFLFPKGFWGTFPPFAIGRTMVDTWMFYRTLALGGALVDLSPTVTIVHQAHDHSHHPQGIQGVYNGLEAQRNLDLAGGYQHVASILDANWILTPQGLKQPRLTRQRLRWYLQMFPLRHPYLSLAFQPSKLGRAVARRTTKNRVF
jgi:hypothetical protein